MDTIKRALGFVWLLLAAAAAWFCIFVFGLPKFQSGKKEDLVFGIIILCVLTPLIVLGMGTFGWFSIRGEYDKGKE